MTRHRTTQSRAGLVWLGLVFGLVVLGCNKNKDGGGGNQQPQGPSMPEGPSGGPPGGPSAEEVAAKLPGGEEFAAAKKVYANNNCANCHKLGETGGGMSPGVRPGGPGGPGGPPPGGPGGFGGRGPDLTSAGAHAEHAKPWLADHIRNPKQHKPQSRMPAFGPDKISDADLALLADYLASRK